MGPQRIYNLEVADLIVTQNGLRADITDLYELVITGHVFNVESLTDYGIKNQGGRVSPVIQLSRFEDGLIYIHDGHHRCAAICMGGRKFVYPSEYQLTDWTYQDYYEPAYHNNWYLPFDPRTEVRHADLNHIKAYVKGRVEDIKAGIWEQEQLQAFLLRNSNLYKLSRAKAGVTTIKELV